MGVAGTEILMSRGESWVGVMSSESRSCLQMGFQARKIPSGMWDKKYSFSSGYPLGLMWVSAFVIFG